jgi:hypothetical protein
VDVRAQGLASSAIGSGNGYREVQPWMIAEEEPTQVIRFRSRRFSCPVDGSEVAFLVPAG